MPGPGQLGGPGLPGKVRIANAQLTSEAVFEHDNFNRFIKDIERMGDNFMADLAGKMAKRAKQYAPVRTGKLRNSIQPVLLRGGRHARVFSDVPYAPVMEYGSRPHKIHGVRKNFKWKKGRFVWNDPKFGPIDEVFQPGVGPGGRESERRGHYRRQNARRNDQYMNWTYAHGATVNHPGTRPYKFMERAFKEVWPEARTVMREAYHR